MRTYPWSATFSADSFIDLLLTQSGKAAEALCPGGTLALFWHRTAGQADPEAWTCHIIAIDQLSEVTVHIGTLVLVLWLIIGAIAAGQRHDYTSPPANCDQAATIAVTILAGPLNYFGVDPKISCHIPQPSK